MTELLSVSHYQHLFPKEPDQKTVLPFCTLYIQKVFEIATLFLTVSLEGFCSREDTLKFVCYTGLASASSVYQKKKKKKKNMVH